MVTKYSYPSWWKMAASAFLGDIRAKVLFKPKLIDLSVNGTDLKFFLGDPTGASWYRNASGINDDIENIENLLLPKGDSSVIVEAGCHHGLTTLLLAKRVPNGHVYAFEALPKNVEILSKNIGLNGCGNVTVIGKAVGSKGGEITIKEKPNSAVIPGAKCGLRVQVISIDEFVAQSGIVPDLLKIDVEGFEYDVFKGAVETLKKRPAVFVEIHTEIMGRYGHDVDDVWKHIDKTAYDVWVQRGHQKPAPYAGEPITSRLHLLCRAKATN